VAAGAGVALLFTLDGPVRDLVQDHRSGGLDDLAAVAKTFHKPEVTLAAGGGVFAAGLVLENRKVAMTGVQIVVSYGLATGLMRGTKWAFGRSRPSATPDDNTSFDWFDGDSNSAFPSGAAAVSFSLATVAADAIDHPVARVLLYTAAAANSWARIYSDRHWFTDVTLGALYGITSAKLVNGRWRLFGWRLPTVVPKDGGVALSYQVSW